MFTALARSSSLLPGLLPFEQRVFRRKLLISIACVSRTQSLGSVREAAVNPLQRTKSYFSSFGVTSTASASTRSAQRLLEAKTLISLCSLYCRRFLGSTWEAVSESAALHQELFLLLRRHVDSLGVDQERALRNPLGCGHRLI
jgi:hypothetical protein